MILKCFLSRLIAFCLMMSFLPLTMQCNCSEHKMVARVGRFEITKKDVTYRNAITQVYLPQESQKQGRDFLIKSFVYAQILENKGYKIDQGVLRQEEDRIQRTMKPEVLHRIKNIFGSDQESYLKVFVLPTYAERTLYYEYFLHDPQVQEPSRRKAQKYLARMVRRPQFFGREPPAEARSRNKFIVSMEHGLTWELDEIKTPESLSASIPPKPEAEERQHEFGGQERGKEGRKWHKEVVSAVAPGEVFPKVMDMGEMWLVARYLGPQKVGATRTHHFEGVLFPKADFDDWLRREKDKVNVEMYEI